MSDKQPDYSELQCARHRNDRTFPHESVYSAVWAEMQSPSELTMIDYPGGQLNAADIRRLANSDGYKEYARNRIAEVQD